MLWMLQVAIHSCVHCATHSTSTRACWTVSTTSALAACVAGPPMAACPAHCAKLHSEPYIVFSTDKKSLLCIRCFRDMQRESRAHCVDLESAYVQGCERLEQAVLAVKALQTATKEAIALLQAMVEEVRHSAAEEEAAIHALFGSMQDRLAERKALLLQTVQR